MKFEEMFKKQESWRLMFDRFIKEWKEGHETYLDHQCGFYGDFYRSGTQVSDWYYRHGQRMLAERRKREW